MEERDRLNDKVLETKWQLRAALNNMAQGLVMIDSKARILVANAQYRQMYQLPPELLGPTASSATCLQYRASKGLFTGDVKAMVDAILARISKGNTSSSSAWRTAA